MKKSSPLILSFLFLITLGLGLGCAKKPDDAKISREIQHKFSQDSGLSTKQLAVKADAGVVTLSGTVDNDAQRDAAGMQAASIAGVKTVINNLEVSNVNKPSAVAEMTPPAAPPAASAPADNTPPSSATKPAKGVKSSKSRHDSRTGQKGADDSAAQPLSSDNASQQASNSNMAAPPSTVAAPAPPPPPPHPKKYIIDQGTPAYGAADRPDR